MSGQAPARRRSRDMLRGGVWIVLASLGCFRVSGEEDAVERMNRGVALLEQYNYADAFKIFDALARAYPGWEAAHVNKGIAALNLQDKYVEVAKAALGRALEIQPRCIHALLTRGILHQHQGATDAMLADFEAASRLDLRDPHALHYFGIALAEKGRLPEARSALEKVLKLQPSFASAHYRLREIYLKGGDRERMSAAVAEFQRLETANAGIKAGLKYGEGGKYNLAQRGTVPPGWKDGGGPSESWKAPGVPVFGPRVVISPGAAAPRIRPDGETQPPALALGDLDGDGALEVVLSGEALERKDGAEGSQAGAAVYTRGAGQTYSRREVIPADADGVVLGDIDGDTDLDLLLAGTGWLRLFVNDGAGALAEKAFQAEGASFSGFPVRLYCVDADSDWDLDVVLLREEAAAGGTTRSRIEILNNNRDGTFRDIAHECGFEPFDGPAQELVMADLDGDIDQDIVLFSGSPPVLKVFANDRVWRFRAVDPAGAPIEAAGLRSVQTGDLDGDGAEDLVLFCGDSLRLLRNVGDLRFEEDLEFGRSFKSVGGTAGVISDFEGAFRSSLLVLDGAAEGGQERGPVFIGTRDSKVRMPVPTLGKFPAGSAVSGAVAVLRDGSPPELIVHDTARGAGSHALPAGANWIAFDLAGPKTPKPTLERANTAGIGASLEAQSGKLRALFHVPAAPGGTARCPSRLHFGLAGRGNVDFIRILWPDGILQAELSLAGGRLHRIQEIERKPSSCPVLFAWTGTGYEFVGDFLGVGGLGYLELPGVYSRPDPTEYVLLPKLEPLGGSFRLDVLEPLEECTYLDELKLTVVEHPDGVTVLPEEMFAVKGPPPGFGLLAFRERIFPGRALDAQGVDVTEALREVDRRYAYLVRRDTRFPGLARGSHVLDLDFDGSIDGILAGAREGQGKDQQSPRPFLILHGFVEYGYSTSNFAAWQARAVFHPPSVRVERGGKWVTLREEWGFPAGTPRYMAVDLTGLLQRGDRRLRVDTDMDIHWDQAFLANADAGGSISWMDLDADGADLQFRGFPDEESPDGSIPPVYVHRDFEPTVSYKTFPGAYTKYGDVRELLSSADDRFVVFGPGDGLLVDVRAERLAPLPPGRRRTFLVKATGYCKDMDLYTAHPDRVEPLPFLEMSGYPYGPGERYPAGARHEQYLREWNTRAVK